jgi:predicted metal-dependent hydrolase
MHCQPSSLTVAPPPAAYSAFFTCFNDGQYFEAHEVLEELWLEVRHDADGNFYKGLIQFAAAFLHWQEGRTGPAAALLRTAGGHLARYPERHHGLDVARVRQMTNAWADDLATAASSGQTLPCARPRLELDPS